MLGVGNQIFISQSMSYNNNSIKIAINDCSAMHSIHLSIKCETARPSHKGTLDSIQIKY